MKNFLFVIPRFAKVGEYYTFPVGMGYVISYMKHKGFNVYCLNLCHYGDPVEKLLLECIEKNQIDFLCTGAMSYNWKEVDDVLVAAKSVSPKIMTVAGGPIVTADPTFALENLQIDYGVIGEGELTMAELGSALCNGTSIDKVNGLIFFDKDKNLIITKPRAAISNLDLLPFPDYAGIEYDKWVSQRWMEKTTGSLYFDINEKQRLCELITSRGCPFSCTFCYHPLGKEYRQRSMDNVFKEIDYLVKTFDANIFNILDELFSVNEERVFAFTQRIKKYNVRWMAQWRVTNVNKRILKEIKESGVLQIGLGIESMSDKILKSMKKKITKAQIENSLKLAHDEGVRVVGNIILGDIEDTEETIKESVNWWLEHPEYEITIGFILAVPDAPIYKFAATHNLIKNKLQFIKERFPIINLSKMSDKKFNEVRKQVNYLTSTHKNRPEGKILSTRISTLFDNGRRIYDFRIECPLCQSISEYSYFQYSQKPYSIITCKHCYKRLKISTKKVFFRDYNSFRGIILQIVTVAYFTFLKRFSIFRRIRNMIKK